jgi:hypothetical protein
MRASRSDGASRGTQGATACDRCHPDGSDKTEFRRRFGRRGLRKNCANPAVPTGTQVAARLRTMKTSALVFTLLLPAFVPAPAVAATIRVPADAATIQQAIDAAVAGDTVLVSPGTYVENITFRGKAITSTATTLAPS